MTLTPEQAKARASRILADLNTAAVTDWDTAILDQVVLHLASRGEPFGMNDIRLIVPEDACRNAGLYFRALVETEHPIVLRVIGEQVSINPKAHGKKVNVYRLTIAGRIYLQERVDARIEQRKAAA